MHVKALLAPCIGRMADSSLDGVPRLLLFVMQDSLGGCSHLLRLSAIWETAGRDSSIHGIGGRDLLPHCMAIQCPGT